MYFLWLVVIAAVVFLDQMTKMLVILYLKPVGDMPLWENVFHFTYMENTGAAMGMLGEADQRWIFMSISTVAIVALLVYFLWKKPQDKRECLAIMFIVGGGIGNMIDRVALGYVVDFINVKFIPFWKWIFNVADAFVCVGAVLWMLTMILSMVKEYRIQKSAEQLMDESEDAPVLSSDELPNTASEDDDFEEGGHDAFGA